MSILSPNPMSYFVCDETSPFDIEFTDGHIKGVCILLCVSVVTRKLYLIPMKLQNLTNIIQALEIISYCHGQVNLILDQHKTRIALGNRPRVTKLDPEHQAHPKLPTLFNLLHDNKTNQKGYNNKNCFW